MRDSVYVLVRHPHELRPFVVRYDCFPDKSNSIYEFGFEQILDPLCGNYESSEKAKLKAAVIGRELYELEGNEHAVVDLSFDSKRRKLRRLS